MLRKVVGVVAGVIILGGTMFAGTAGAAGTKNYTYTGGSSGDSSTCGPDWANDTFTRVFKVVKLQNHNGSYRVTESFTHGLFTTLAAPSPESCANGNSNTIAAGINGHFSGSEVLTVTDGTFTAPATVDCGTPCTTDGFVTAAFGPSATSSSSDYYFEYTIGGRSNCLRDWVDAATGDGGDIATTCAP